MKTFRILSCILMAVLSAGILMAEVKVPSQHGNPVIKSKVAKTTIYRNQVIPVVTLPEITITSIKSGSVILPVSYNNGVLIAEATLPEVEISASYTGLISTDNPMITINLPVVEITGVFPYEKLASIKQINGIPVIDLPEINIMGKVSANNDAHDQILLVTLPEVHISAQRYNWNFNLSEPELYNGKDVKWIYISLKNCGITTDNKVICEVTSANPLILPGEPVLERLFN